jgi:hypothetical protein
MRLSLKHFFWTSLAASLAIYAVMVLWSLPYIQQQAQGLRPFDLHPGGYSLAEAGEFLGKLSEQGRSFYLAVQHRLDLFYPALLALTLASGMWLMAPASWKAARWLLVILPLPGMVFDYLENRFVAALLKSDPTSLDEEVVAAASLATIIKSIATTIAITVFLLLLVMRIWRKRRSAA